MAAALRVPGLLVAVKERMNPALVYTKAGFFRLLFGKLEFIFVRKRVFRSFLFYYMIFAPWALKISFSFFISWLETT